MENRFFGRNTLRTDGSGVPCSRISNNELGKTLQVYSGTIEGTSDRKNGAYMSRQIKGAHSKQAVSEPNSSTRG